MKFVTEKNIEDLISYARWEIRDDEVRTNATNLSMFITLWGVDKLEQIEAKVDAVYRPYITPDDVVDMFSDDNTIIPNAIGCEDWDEVWEEVESRRGRK